MGRGRRAPSPNVQGGLMLLRLRFICCTAAGQHSTLVLSCKDSPSLTAGLHPLHAVDSVCRQAAWATAAARAGQGWRWAGRSRQQADARQQLRDIKRV